jgi:glycosyltransferase involved in cell wall biosynthesis
LVRASSGNGGSGSGGGGGSNNNDNNSNNPWFSGLHVTTILSVAALLSYITTQPKIDLLPTENAPVSIIVPALNEQKDITETLTHLKSLRPSPAEIIVVDGGSTDNTVKLAKKAGATVVKSKRGRGLQQNKGAEKARRKKTVNTDDNSILMFVHSDSRPPHNAILLARKTLADPRIILGGFFTSIEHNGKILLFTTFHQFISTYYAPLLFAGPLSFARGLKCMFGDQSLFVRAEDFWRIGGFNNKLPIMEDADLCLRLHQEGIANGKGRYREVQLNNCVNRTSGRRIAPWGNWQTTKIHFKLALAWWRGEPPETMWRMYDEWYTDALR